MFSKISSLLDAFELGFTVKKLENGKYKVIVTFKFPSEEDHTSLAPLVLTGEPDELDEQFISLVKTHLGDDVLAIAEQVSNLKKQLVAAQKDVAKKATGKKAPVKKQPAKPEGPKLDFEAKTEEKKDEPKVEKPKRKRRTKAQIEADKKAEEEAPEDLVDIPEEKPVEKKKEEETSSPFSGEEVDEDSPW